MSRQYKKNQLALIFCDGVLCVMTGEELGASDVRYKAHMAPPRQQLRLPQQTTIMLAL